MMKKILIGICVAATVLIAGIGFLWGNEIKTLSSFKTIINQNLSHKDGYTYEMTFSGDYYFDDFLEQGGVSDDKELISFITEKIAKGIIPISIEAPEIACSSFTATTEDGDFLFGRNYDFDPTNTAIIKTNPGNGRHASVSTVDLHFLGVDSEKGVSGLLEKVKLLACPYIPLDGINDAGVACGIYMTYQGKDTVATDQNTEKPDITSTTMLRLILDYADDVEEAIALVSEYDLHDSANTSYHYMVADAKGNSAILEWVAGTDTTDNDGSKRELRVIRNEKPYQAVTNFIVEEGYYEESDEKAGYDRYEYLTENLEASDGIVKDEEEAMGLLKGVGRRTWLVDGDVTKGTTIHSAVYNLTDGTSYWVANENYGSEEHRKFYDVNEFDF